MTSLSSQGWSSSDSWSRRSNGHNSLCRTVAAFIQVVVTCDGIILAPTNSRRYLLEGKHVNSLQITHASPPALCPLPAHSVRRAEFKAPLFPESVPVSTPLLVQISQEDPLRGNVVWLGQGTSTILGTRIPHGVAFEEPVEAALIRQWVSQSKQRLHARAPVRFDIEYTQAQAIVQGTCLSLSRGGMFITTRRPAVPGPEILLHFTPPGLSDRLSILAHVVWVCKEETAPSAITGMGVQFLELEASEAIGSVVDRLCAEAIPPADPSRLLLPPSR
jgi:type IV pilus assembly protein PilZ